ncbi:MAG: ABC transporter permease subunit [Clostridiales bacterium]|nr:ABC transporter permease subunit [Clostridiales bacterium]
MKNNSKRSLQPPRQGTSSHVPRIVRGALVLIFWLAVWEMISLIVGLDLLVPSPLTVARTWLKLAGTSKFWLSTLLSLGRVLLGAVAGIMIGGLLAFLTHYVSIARLLLEPLIKVVRAVPVASFIILALVWIKTEALPSFISAAMAAPLVWQSVSGALESDVDRQLLEMGYVYNFGRVKIFTHIVLPSIFPAFIASSVSALGFAWKSGIAAEVICQPALSIGKQLQAAKIYLETPQVFAWTCTVCVLSMSLEGILKAVVRRYGAKRSGGNKNG